MSQEIKQISLRQYKALCKACDRILLMPSSTLERVCISWLHVIRPHPVYLISYYDLFYSSSVGRFFLTFKQKTKYKITTILDLISIINIKLSGTKTFPWYECQNIKKRIDVLFVSHLVDESQINKCDDFYFHNMPTLLADQGYSVVVALINHTGKHEKYLINKFDHTKVPRIIISNSLAIGEEIKLYRRMKAESAVLKKISITEGCQLSKKILLRASEEAMSRVARGTLRKFEQFVGISKKYKPKVLITTYEGHAWERVAFNAVRKTVQNIRCIGYQHSMYFGSQHAIGRNLSSKYNPDGIMASGVDGYEKFKNFSSLNDVELSIIGSRRAFNIEKTKYNNYSHACLVIPDAIESECLLLFNFSLLCAEKCKDVKFIWRLHPEIKFDSLHNKGIDFMKLPENIHLSTDSLCNDINNSQWSLYRGTTTIIQAVGSGVRPIYFKVPGEICIDPLEAMNGWRVFVSNVGDFIRFLKIDSEASDNSKEYEYYNACQYCKKIFTPIDSSTFISFIN